MVLYLVEVEEWWSPPVVSSCASWAGPEGLGLPAKGGGRDSVVGVEVSANPRPVHSGILSWAYTTPHEGGGRGQVPWIVTSPSST